MNILNTTVFLTITAHGEELLTMKKSVDIPSILLASRDAFLLQTELTDKLEHFELASMLCYNAITSKVEIAFDDSLDLDDIDVSVASKVELDRFISQLRGSGWDVQPNQFVYDDFVSDMSDTKKSLGKNKKSENEPKSLLVKICNFVAISVLGAISMTVGALVVFPALQELFKNL